MQEACLIETTTTPRLPGPQEAHPSPKDLSVHKAGGTLHWLQDDLPVPTGFSITLWVLLLLNPQLLTGRETSSLKHQAGLVKARQCLTNMLLFWVLNNPSSLRDRKCAFSMFQHILLANVTVIKLTGLVNGIQASP